MGGWKPLAECTGWDAARAMSSQTAAEVVWSLQDNHQPMQHDRLVLLSSPLQLQSISVNSSCKAKIYSRQPCSAALLVTLALRHLLAVLLWTVPGRVACTLREPHPKTTQQYCYCQQQQCCSGRRPS